MKDHQLIQFLDADLNEIEKIISNIPGILEVLLFGSRATGKAKPGSDIDLAIRCKPGAISAEVVRDLSAALNEETNLPYRFDVIDLEATTHKELLKHIQCYGRKIWPK